MNKLETAPARLGKRQRLLAEPVVADCFSQLLSRTCTLDMLRKALRGDKYKKLRQEAGQAALDEVGVKLTSELALAGLELGDGNLKMYR